MANIEIKIPQLGEGLQEARLLQFLKQPGDAVRQDEPIYEMETDKATMEIESPASGVLASWTAQEDDVLPIGATIGQIAVQSAVGGEPTAVAPGTEPAEPDVNSAVRNGAEAVISLADDSTSRVSVQPIPFTPSSPSPTGVSPQPLMPNDLNALLRNSHVSPRTRAYAREKGLTDEEVARLVLQADGKLLPAAIDAFLQKGAKRGVPTPAAVSPAAKSRTQDVPYVDSPLPTRQRTLAYRMQRSASVVIPATMELAVNWNAVEALRTQLKGQAGADARTLPSQFLLFAWCVAQASIEHPRFRAALVNDSTLREYAHLHLGIAVSRPGDELLMARVTDADTLDFSTFITRAQDAIERARQGEDQSSDAMQLSLTTMGGTGVRMGIPIVVAPAVGTIFLGSPYDEAYPLPGGGIGFRRLANLVFTFDHRIANGIGAARFLASIQQRVETLTL